MLVGVWVGGRGREAPGLVTRKDLSATMKEPDGSHSRIGDDCLGPNISQWACWRGRAPRGSPHAPTSWHAAGPQDRFYFFTFTSSSCNAQDCSQAVLTIVSHLLVKVNTYALIKLVLQIGTYLFVPTLYFTHFDVVTRASYKSVRPYAQQSLFVLKFWLVSNVA